MVFYSITASVSRLLWRSMCTKNAPLGSLPVTAVNNMSENIGWNSTSTSEGGSSELALRIRPPIIFVPSSKLRVSTEELYQLLRVAQTQATGLRQRAHSVRFYAGQGGSTSRSDLGCM